MRLVHGVFGACASIVLAAGALVVPVSTLAASRPCVVTTGGARFGSLQRAVNAATPGAVITVRGRCVGPTVINLKPLTIRGKYTRAYGQPTLDGAGANVLSDSSDLTVSDLTIRGGGTGFVVGKKSEATTVPVVRLVRVEITDNTLAIDADGVDLTVSSSEVTDNGSGIAATRFDTVLRVRDTDISDNTGYGIRGHIGPVITVRDSNIHHNGGDGIYNGDGAGVTATGRTRIHHNGGDGIFVELNSVTLRDTASIYRNAGAGVSTYGGSVACGDRSSIHHNGAYGIRISFRGGAFKGCVEGDNVHDNVPADILCLGGIEGLPEYC